MTTTPMPLSLCWLNSGESLIAEYGLTAQAERKTIVQSRRSRANALLIAGQG